MLATTGRTSDAEHRRCSNPRGGGWIRRCRSRVPQRRSPPQRLALAMMIAPAWWSRRTWNASCPGRKCSRTGVPAVVGMSAVSMLSFTTSGIPCSGPRDPDSARSASRAAASARARGLIVISALSSGPASSHASVRARKKSTSPTEVIRPFRMARCSSAMVASIGNGTCPEIGVFGGGSAAAVVVGVLVAGESVARCEAPSRCSPREQRPGRRRPSMCVRSSWRDH